MAMFYNAVTIKKKRWSLFRNRCSNSPFSALFFVVFFFFYYKPIYQTASHLLLFYSSKRIGTLKKSLHTWRLLDHERYSWDIMPASYLNTRMCNLFCRSELLYADISNIINNK